MSQSTTFDAYFGTRPVWSGHNTFYEQCLQNSLKHLKIIVVAFNIYDICKPTPWGSGSFFGASWGYIILENYQNNAINNIHRKYLKTWK